MNYKQRVLSELVELNWKIADLKHFIGNNTCTEILDKQLQVMNTYSQILYERLLVMLEETEVVTERR